MTTEKIKSLLLMNENKKITVTLLAKKMNVSKATMSRMINTFYEQGLTLDKGKCTIRRDIPGSNAFVPSTVGLIIASEVVKDLTTI